MKLADAEKNRNTSTNTTTPTAHTTTSKTTDNKSTSAPLNLRFDILTGTVLSHHHLALGTNEEVGRLRSVEVVIDCDVKLVE